MSEQLAPLEQTRREQLRKVCEDLNLLCRFDMIELQAQRLQAFERYGKARLKTPQGESKALEDVRKAARLLAAAIDTLSDAQQRLIALKLPPDGLKVLRGVEVNRPGAVAQFTFEEADCHISYPVKFTVLGRVSYLGLESSRLAATIQHLQQPARESGGRQGGRKPTLDEYAWHIGCLHTFVYGLGIKLARGGDFERLCSAVYFAAGIDAEPDGAIRRYIENKSHADALPDDTFF